MKDEWIVVVKCVIVPALTIGVEIGIEERHSDAPHFREKSNVGPQRKGLPAEFISFLKAPLFIEAASGHLQQGNIHRCGGVIHRIDYGS